MESTKQFYARMQSFREQHAAPPDSFLVSIKVHVDTGCYRPCCCPVAWKIIDNELEQLGKIDQQDFVFVKHESGPEILTWVGGAFDLAAGILSFVTAIINARSEGRKHGDKHDEPVTLLVRREETENHIVEERLMTFSGNENVTTELIIALLSDGVRKIAPSKKKKSITKTSKRKNS